MGWEGTLGGYYPNRVIVTLRSPQASGGRQLSRHSCASSTSPTIPPTSTSQPTAHFTLTQPCSPRIQPRTPSPTTSRTHNPRPLPPTSRTSNWRPLPRRSLLPRLLSPTSARPRHIRFTPTTRSSRSTRSIRSRTRTIPEAGPTATASRAASTRAPPRMFQRTRTCP